MLPAGQIRRLQPTRTCEQPGCPRYGAIIKQARTVKASVQRFVACKIFTALDYCAKDISSTIRDASPRGRFSSYVSAGFWAPWDPISKRGADFRSLKNTTRSHDDGQS